MAEQTDIDLDSVIDRLLEGESMFHLERPLSFPSPILFTHPSILSPYLLPPHTCSPIIAAPFAPSPHRA